MMDDNSPIRVGLLGYGYAGKTFHAPLITAVPGIELCAVASRSVAKVHADYPAMEVYADPHSLIVSGDIDLVVIATPNDTHAPLAHAAIAAGKHVVVDKPFTLNVAEARELVAYAEQHGVLLSIFHNRRWDSDFLTVAKAIKDELIGTVSHFESHFDRFRPAVRDRWRERSGLGSGVWFDLGPHLVDQAMQLFGHPDRVQGSLAMQRDGAVTDDWAHVVLSYQQHRVVLHAGMLVAGGTHRFLLHGEKGSIVKHGSDRQEQQLLDGMRPGEPGWGQDSDALIVFDGATGERCVPALSGDQRCYYAAIVNAVRGCGASPVPASEAVKVMEIVEAAAQSARDGATIKLL